MNGSQMLNSIGGAAAAAEGPPLPPRGRRRRRGATAADPEPHPCVIVARNAVHMFIYIARGARKCRYTR